MTSTSALCDTHRNMAGPSPTAKQIRMQDQMNAHVPQRKNASPCMCTRAYVCMDAHVCACMSTLCTPCIHMHVAQFNYPCDAHIQNVTQGKTRFGNCNDHTMGVHSKRTHQCIGTTTEHILRICYILRPSR